MFISESACEFAVRRRPTTVCPEREAWREFPLAQRVRYLARQGQASLSSDLVRLVEDRGRPDT